MAIPLLPKWNLHPNRPCFYDTDSATMLELAAKMQGAFNEMVEDYNNFTISVNDQMQLFMDTANADQAAFMVGIRQEFQDFIDIADLKYQELDNMVSVIKEKLMRELNDAIRSGSINVVESYDPETESLNMTVTGGV